MDIKDNLLLVLALLWIIQTLAFIIIGVGLVIAGVIMIFEGNFLPLIAGGVLIAIGIVEVVIMIVMVD